LAEHARESGGASDPHLLDTLAAPYAEAGRFPKAIATIEKAVALADAAKDAVLTERCRARLGLYRQERPYHEPTSRSAP
jgi:hypothetical protein